MTKLQIKGGWNSAKDKLNRKWSKLTDNYLQYVERKGDELLGRIQKRSGNTREVVEKAVKDASASCDCTFGSHWHPEVDGNRRPPR